METKNTSLLDEKDCEYEIINYDIESNNIETQTIQKDEDLDNVKKQKNIDAEIERIFQQNDKLISIAEKYNSKCVALEKENNILKAQNTELCNKLKDKEALILQMEETEKYKAQNNEAIHEVKNIMVAKFSEMQELISQSQDMFKSYEKYKSIEVECERHSNNYEMLNTKYNTQSAEYKILYEKYNKLADDHYKLCILYDTLIKEHDKYICQKTTELNNIENKYISKLDEYNNIYAEHNTSLLLLDEIKNQLAEKNIELDNIKAEHIKELEKYNEISEEKEKLIILVNETKEKLDSAVNDAQETHLLCNETKFALDNLRIEYDEIKQELIKIKKELEHKELQIKNKSNEFSAQLELITNKLKGENKVLGDIIKEKNVIFRNTIHTMQKVRDYIININKNPYIQFSQYSTIGNFNIVNDINIAIEELKNYSV